MIWKIPLVIFFFYQQVSSDHVTFFGRYACNINANSQYCTKDTFVGRAFYYGLIDGKGMTENGTFVNSTINVRFYDPTVQGKFARNEESGHYTTTMLNTMLNENDSDLLLAAVGFESDCKQVAALAQSYSRASLLVNCEDQVGESHMPSNMVVEMSSTQGGKYRAFAKLASSLGWTNLAVINFEEDGSEDKTYHNQLLDALSSESITLDYVRKGGFSATQNSATFTGLESLVDVVLETYLKTRIYVLVLQFPIPGQFFMHVMSTLGLLETGMYYIIFISSIQDDEDKYFEFNSNRGSILLYNINYGISDADVRQYYRSMMYFTDVPHYAKNYSDEWTNFLKRIEGDSQKNFCSPLCDVSAKISTSNKAFTARNYYWLSESPAIVNAYNMGLLLSDTVAVHGATILKNSLKLVEHMSERLVQSLLGYFIKFDENRVSQRQYILWSPQEAANNGPISITAWAKPAAKMTPDGKGGYSITWANLSALGVFNGVLPKSRPECGFNDELCPIDLSVLSEIEIILISICVLACLVLAGVIIYIARWIAYERRLESSYFLVSRKEVFLLDMASFGSSKGGSMLQSAMSLKSTMEDEGPGGATMQYYSHGIRRAARARHIENSKNNKKGVTDNRESWLEIEDWHLAKYDNALVTVRKINKPQLKLTREMKRELDLLMTETNETLNRFMGVINESDLIFTIHAYGPRKSLSDLLRNDDLRLDRMFRVSFLEDITKGIMFLHDGSKIGYHGNMKSTNCIVDAYWRIKLSNFGMEKIRQDEPQFKADDMLWLAPEIVRRFGVKHDLTKEELSKADIYSFAIILYEIYGRQGPYGDDFLDSDEIIEQIKFPGGGALTRPDIHLIIKSPQPVTQVVERCWSEEPSERPTIKKIRDLIKPLSAGLKGNIADNIMALLDRYRNNLEDVIKERTEQLEDEKKRNENLLLQLLPKSVANSLKNGLPVEAEFYDSVSIYFSDIVGFTSLSSKSTPLQVVNMLNSLYTIFDTIIDKFDCYKVETIGDAYMFVSGLPELNGYLHAGEVASASFELLKSIQTFVVSHCPDEKLKLRIGNHTGPVVTGVVGIQMPRYCLFGDSVIIANSMESSGEAMRIQISSDAYELVLKCGGYDIQPREKMILKNKLEIMTYWLNGYSKEERISRLVQFRQQYPHLETSIKNANKKLY